MKNFILKSLVVFSIPFLVCCNKNESDNGTKNYGKNLKLMSTTLGGCNLNIDENLKSAQDPSNDSVVIKINSESLNIYLGFNYLCNTPFVCQSNILNDSIFITVTDTCSGKYGVCYAWCDCFYSWNFDFWKGEMDSCYYKLELVSPREGESRVFKEGKIKL